MGDCLIYTNVAGRLNYTVGGEVITLQHLDRPLYIVGYLPKENRCALYLPHTSTVSPLYLPAATCPRRTGAQRANTLTLAVAPALTRTLTPAPTLTLTLTLTLILTPARTLTATRAVARLYLIDRDYSIVSYSLLLAVLEYPTAARTLARSPNANPRSPQPSPSP